MSDEVKVIRAARPTQVQSFVHTDGLTYAILPPEIGHPKPVVRADGEWAKSREDLNEGALKGIALTRRNALLTLGENGHFKVRLGAQ